MADNTITVNDPRKAIEVIVNALDYAKDWWPNDQAKHILRELQREGFDLKANVK